MKKFKNLREFKKSKEFKNKDLTNCDLSNLNLSRFPEGTWEDFIFDHTNFKNTNIKFLPYTLRKIDAKEYMGDEIYNGYAIKMEYCDFTNCDLSYIDDDDFGPVSVNGCNFTNTGLRVEWKGYFTEMDSSLDYISDTQIPKSFIDVTFDACDFKYYFLIIKRFDIKTLRNNPGIKINDNDFFKIIKDHLPSIYDYKPNSKIIEILNYIDDMLEENKKRGGKLYELFYLLNNDSPFTEREKIMFFQGYIVNKEFNHINLCSFSKDLIEQIEFTCCKIKLLEVNDFSYSIRNRFFNDKIEKFHCLSLLENCWNEEIQKRFGRTNITIKRNLYLELGRKCNANCAFCRNNSLSSCKYSLKKIKENLKLLSESVNQLDTIFIGGGEPTLVLDNVDCIATEFRDNDLVLITNGSYEDYERLLYDTYYYLSISRHAVDDNLNNEIFKTKTYDHHIIREIGYKYGSDVTLNATCFKGVGLDTVEKLEEYIDFAQNARISHVLFQNLHKDIEQNKKCAYQPIDDRIFDEMIEKLINQGWNISSPIYSSGDYVLYIATNGAGNTISFKKYITKEELECMWPYATKRTIDLSMDPSGNLYSNWHQESGKILLKKH